MGIPSIPAATATSTHNERTKLLANAIDRASTAMGAGSLWPLVSLIRPGCGLISRSIIVEFLTGVVGFVAMAFLLHYLARRALGGLR
jgi:hypothetical protein